MPWIEYHTALRDHWKISRLSAIVGCEYVSALGMVSCLWLWAAEYAKNGDISRFSDEEIRSAARTKCEKLSHESLKKCELEDQNGFINDWKEHGIKLLVSSRKRQKEYRKNKRNANVTVASFLPNHTIPNQTNKYKHMEDQSFSGLMTDFSEMRKKMRCPLTEKAIELTLKKLQRFDLPTAKAMIEQSIERGWRGIFEIKKQNDHQQRGQQDDHDRQIEERLGKIATKDMIKAVLKTMEPCFWWKIEKFLQKRYPGGGNGYQEAVRETEKEIRDNFDRLNNLTAGIGK